MIIAYLNCGYIDHTNSPRTVSDANRPMVDRQLADFVCDFSCFLGSASGKKIITDHFYFFSIGRLSLGLGEWLGVDRPSVDYRPIIGRRSADTPPTSIFKMSHSNLANC